MADKRSFKLQLNFKKKNSYQIYLLAFLVFLISVKLIRGQETAVEETKEEASPPPKQLTCDYGSGQEVSTCSFEVDEDSSHPNVKWKIGTGSTAIWLGGPLKDRTTQENTGGYLYLDTSYKIVNKVFSSAALESGERPILNVKNFSNNLPPSPGHLAKFNSSSFKKFSNIQNNRFSDSQNRLTNTIPHSEKNHLVYEKKFMQELWHSGIGLQSNQHKLFNSNDSINHQNNNQSIPFNVVSNVFNKNQNNLSDKNISTVYKQHLIAVTDVLSTPIDPLVPNSGSILSPNISATGPMGNCLRFYYNMDGLSAEKLKILVLDYASGENQTLWQTARQTDGDWVKVELAYAHDKLHKIILEGVAKPYNSPERAYRGYIAVDDFAYSFLGEESIAAGMCHGHCTFEGGLCGWTNLAEEDDFDWSQGRGSDNFYTGPSRDFHSFSREFPLGGYLFIDASYPRRPGDRALLRSPQFPAPVVGTDKNADLEKQENNGPICLKFATHMYGNGIGTLRVKVRSAEESSEANSPDETSKNEKVIWEMTGEAGNNWYLAQLSYASTTSYYFIFEGVIGPNYLGNIAIDSILIEQGACPISPQTASRKSGDCTFEESMCAWTNVNYALGLDHFDWVRQFSYGSYGPKTDHTKQNTDGYFMSLNGDNSLQRGGSYAWLISPQLQTSNQPNSLGKCMSFYYFMYQRSIEPIGPSLGGLRILIRTLDEQRDVVYKLVWRLDNHQSMRWKHAQILIKNTIFPIPTNAIYQVVLEGVWGDARVGAIAVDDITFFDVAEDSNLCKTIPENAASVLGECSFDRNLCGWKNDSLNINEKQSSSMNNKAEFPVLNGKSSLIPHKISITTGGVSGVIPQSVLNSNSLNLYSKNNRHLVRWRLATNNARPNNLQDHTFRAPVGYVYFDVFNQQYMQQPSLRSVKFLASTGDDQPKSKCLSFWFSAFGRGDNSVLSVFLMKLDESSESNDTPSSSSTSTNTAEKKEESTTNEKTESNQILLWTIQSRLLETRRSLWYYAQTSINAETDHQVLFLGEATDGGFAIDDITFYNGTCATRPPEAAVKLKTDENQN